MRLIRWNAILFPALVAVAAFAQSTSFQSMFYKPTFNNLRRIGYADTNTMYAVGDGATFVRTTDGGATFQTYSVSPDNEPLYFIQFATPTIGVAAGDHGLFAITTDGGADWIDEKLPSGERIIGGDFDAATMGGFAATADHHVYYTTNEGATWQASTPPSADASPFVGVSHLSGKTSLVISEASVVYKTTDDGHTWDSLSRANYFNVAGMYFLDSLHGWIISPEYWSYTTDGGNTWNAGWWSSPGIPSVVGGITAVYFVNALNGWTLQSNPISGGKIASTLWRSTDGGHTFLDTAATSSIGNNLVGLNDVRFDNTGRIGWAVGDVGDIRRSTDGGAHWKDLSSGIAEGITPTVSFFDANTGIVCAQSGGGVNYITTNGGTTWPLIKFTGENTQTVAVMLSAQNGVTLGYQSAGSANAYLTTNGGTAWNPVSSVPPGNYTRIYEVDANTIAACGQNGVIGMSADGGAQWKNISISPDQPNLTGIYFTDATHGFTCGGNGALYATSNGGTSWTPNANLTTQADLNDVAFNTSTSGWIASDSDGVVFHSTDGGATWAPVTINPAVHDTLTRIIFADVNTGWIAGSYGQLYQTSDGGTTWTPLNTGTSNKFTDMSCAPRTNPAWLWLAGGSGMVLKYSLNPAGVTESNTPPLGFSLGQNYPNPFSVAGSSTSIPFSLTTAAATRLDIINVLGERIRTLAGGQMTPGSYAVSWDGRDAAGSPVPEGVYFYRLSSGSTRVMRSAIVTK